MTITLSAARQATMWILYMRECGRPLPLIGPFDDGYRAGAIDALTVLGLLAKTAGYAAPRYVLTDAGRAWIAGQVEAAHTEAIIEDAARRVACLRCAADLDLLVH